MKYAFAPQYDLKSYTPCVQRCVWKRCDPQLEFGSAAMVTQSVNCAEGSQRWVAVLRAGSTSLAGRPLLRNLPGWSTAVRRTKDRVKIFPSIWFPWEQISSDYLWELRISSHFSFCIIHHRTQCQITFLLYHIRAVKQPVINIIAGGGRGEETDLPNLKKFIYFRYVSFRQMCFLSNME